MLAEIIERRWGTAPEIQVELKLFRVGSAQIRRTVNVDGSILEPVKVGIGATCEGMENVDGLLALVVRAHEVAKELAAK